MAALGWSVGGLAAQQLTATVPVGVVVQPNATGGATGADPGPTVEMFENPNLDRFMRRAQAFLDREDYPAAIQVLQDVIEGRSIEVIGEGEHDGADGAAGEHPPGTPPAGSTPPPAATSDPGEAPDSAVRRAARVPDSRRSVVSQDGRLFRPIRRLCHEMLAGLPEIGIQLYRAQYEVAARELLDAAMRSGDPNALEQVAQRYFVTLAAGQAMAMLGDRWLAEGRYRAAAQVLTDLAQLYPASSRNQIGVSVVWCRFKIALCLRLAGERDAAREAVVKLAADFPGETLRIAGELQAVKDLPDDSLFADAMVDVRRTAVDDAGPSWLAEPDKVGSDKPGGDNLGRGAGLLVPLWQYRFANQEPYAEPKVVNDGGVAWDRGDRMATMPFAAQYGPATWLRFSRPARGRAGHVDPDIGVGVQALFLEHFRLRSAGATSGLLAAEGDGADVPPVARDGAPRLRVAVCDYALLRPVEDDARRYVVIGPKVLRPSTQQLLDNSLVAYDRATLAPVWNSTQWQDGDDGLRDATFLAAPTLFGERLLLPALRQDVFTLECIDRSTGRPIWHTLLHAGGTDFVRPPGSPVVVQSGIAYVLTNSGCLAAVDAFGGDLRWIRRYERVDPLRPGGRVERNRIEEPTGLFGQARLPTFLANDLVVGDGLVVIAPCDSRMLICVDGATGAPVWMLDATTKPDIYGVLRTIVGANDTDLFALSDSHLVCISLRGGLQRWAVDLPSWNGAGQGNRGRGQVLGDRVLVPGEREILVYDARHPGAPTRVPLPSFDSSRDPLTGPFDIASDGPWLGVGFQGGVEVFSSRSALRELATLATAPVRRATYLTQAGDREAAAAALTAALAAAPPPGDQQHVASHLLAIVRDQAIDLARTGKAFEGLQALDGIRRHCEPRELRLAWHLARLEVCKEAGDVRVYEREQLSLYDYMEGKG